MSTKWKIVIVVLTIPLLVQAQIQSFTDQGQIDWNSKTITAIGIGAPDPNMPAVTARPMAIRAARSAALRNAFEIVKGVQINSSTDVKTFMASNDLIRTQVSGFIQTFKESKPRYMRDKAIKIKVTIPFSEGLNESLMPVDIRNIPKMHQESKSATQSWTGLIIDARGMKVTPAIAPKIVDSNGKEIYGSAYVSRAFAKKWGMVGYAKSRKQARKMTNRIGANPGVIKAVSVTGMAKTDLVISRNDGYDVRVSASTQKFLSDCRVIIVID